MRVEALFHQALDRPPEERATWLAEACAGDADLSAEVTSLLAADARADTGPGWAAPSGETLRAALTDAGDPWIGRTVGPYQLERLIGQGGMGRVYLGRRQGEGFEQRAAIKLVRTGPGREEVLARFAHERATLARLEHPGIARLLDGGATEAGTPWLAMEYVEGRPVDAWCDERGLDVDARLALMIAICEAVSAAHANLVVHRDIKPGNVLVDSEGRPHLLDFGVARVLDADDSARLTVGGFAPMTPAYASPEQVRGEAVGVACDVYALGVLLYELLTGRLPYDLKRDSVVALEWAVCHQEPVRPSRAVAQGTGPRSTSGARSRRLAGDLDNILLKALEKEPARRYGSVGELAGDLRRHLQGLPVRARPQTLRYRTGKFVRRHRAASLLGVLLAALALTAAWQWLDATRRDQQRLDQILRLADGRRLVGLRDQLDGLWPAWPSRGPELDEWIARADALLARHDDHRGRLADLEARIAAGAGDEDTLWWRDELAALVAALDAFGADDAVATTRAAGVARRRMVVDIERLSRVDAADDWRAALASIADREQCPAYDGLQLEPLWGLAPLRRDPRSGLWEFWLVASGERPLIDDRERVVIDEGSAAVLVLLPAHEALVGSQPSDPDIVHLDPWSQPDERPPLAVSLAPYLIGKHELTQGQWARLSGSNPSDVAPGSPAQGAVITLAHPVEHVDWDDAEAVLDRYGLVLPTEVQWEGACRAGTTTPWITGATPEGLDRVANLADLTSLESGGSSGWNYLPAQEHGLRDGFTSHAPVGSFAANPWGLHDVHGNVWEWCRDMPAPYGLTQTAPGDGLRLIPAQIGDLGERILRGGAYSNPPERMRSASRWKANRDFRTVVAGVRVARTLEPLPGR